MEPETDEILERSVVREVAGVIRTPEALDTVVDAFELAGFDRADIGVMANIATIRDRFWSASRRQWSVRGLTLVKATVRGTVLSAPHGYGSRIEFLAP